MFTKQQPSVESTACTDPLVRFRSLTACYLSERSFSSGGFPKEANIYPSFGKLQLWRLPSERCKCPGIPTFIEGSASLLMIEDYHFPMKDVRLPPSPLPEGRGLSETSSLPSELLSERASSPPEVQLVLKKARPSASSRRKGVLRKASPLAGWRRASESFTSGKRRKRRKQASSLPSESAKGETCFIKLGGRRLRKAQQLG